MLKYRVSFEANRGDGRVVTGSEDVWITSIWQIKRAICDKLRQMGWFGYRPEDITVIRREYVSMID